VGGGSCVHMPEQTQRVQAREASITPRLPHDEGVAKACVEVLRAGVVLQRRAASYNVRCAPIAVC